MIDTLNISCPIGEIPTIVVDVYKYVNNIY